MLGSLQSHALRVPELNDFSPGKLLDKSDVRPIIEALQSTNPIRESIALELCVHIKHETLFAALQPFLSHPDARKRLLAFQAISGYKKGMEEIFLLGIQDPEPAIRCEAVRQLKKILQQGPRLNELLAKLLHDPSAQVMMETIIALHDNAELTIQKELERQIQAMLAGDDEHRFQVCRAIQKIQARQYDPQVMALLASETSARVRISAVNCLGELGCLESIPLLLGLYANADPELRQSIESALIQMGEAAIPELSNNLGSFDTDSWYLSVVSLSSLDQDTELTLRVNESCIRKIASFQRINRIPALLEEEGCKDLAGLYRLRVEEVYDYIQVACWKTLAISIDPIIIGRLKEALKKTPAVDKREQALELLTELSRKHSLIVEMLRVLYEDSPVRLEQQMPCLQSLNNAILAFPDPWLNRFSNYAIAHLEKGDSLMANHKKAGQVEKAQETESSQDMNAMIEQMVLLKKVPLFSQLGISELSLIAKISSEEILPDETMLIEEGMQSHKLYIIMQGWVEVSAHLSEDQQGSLGIQTEPSCLGEDSIFTGNPSPVCAQIIMGKARILIIDGEDLKRLIRLNPEIGIGLLASTSSRLQKLQRMMIIMQQS